MQQKSKVIIGIIIVIALVLIILGMRNKDRVEPEEIMGNETRTEQTVNARALNESGDYTIVGTVQVPSPCHDLDVRANEDNEEAVVLEFELEQPDVDEACTQVVTDKNFRVSFNASEDATITATMNTLPVRINLVPVETEAELGEVEIKG